MTSPSSLLDEFVIAIRAPETELSPFAEDGWFVVGRTKDFIAARNHVHGMSGFLHEFHGEACVLRIQVSAFDDPVARPQMVRLVDSSSPPALDELRSLSDRELSSFETLIRSYSARRSYREWTEFVHGIDQAAVSSEVMDQIARSAPPAPKAPPPLPFWKRIDPVVRRRLKRAILAFVGIVAVSSIGSAVAQALQAGPDPEMMVKKLEVYRDGAYDLVKPDPQAKGFMVRIRCFPDGQTLILDRFPVDQPPPPDEAQGLRGRWPAASTPARQRDLSRLTPAMRGIAEYFNRNRA